MTSTQACKMLGRESGENFKLFLAFTQPEFPNRKTKDRHLWVKFPHDTIRLAY